MGDSFPGLLDSDEDLQRMYSLLSRIPDGLEPLQNKFPDHVAKMGLAAISKLVGEFDSSTELLDSQGLRRCLAGDPPEVLGDCDEEFQRRCKVR